MKKLTKKLDRRPSDSLPYGGHQWGEPPNEQSQFLVTRLDDDLEITAAMPEYLSDSRSRDLLKQYKIARKNRSIGKQRTGKDLPHIRFANADSDDELIEFMRSFGPVVSKSWEILPYRPKLIPGSNDITPLLMTVRQDLAELRSEQRIYKAALNLVVELGKKDLEFDIESVAERICEISEGFQDWPRQWSRERKARGKNPLWRVPTDSIRRVSGLANSERDAFLPAQVDARIVICELVNVFPLLAFPNLSEMHSYIRFGIRPILYNILRSEFLHSREVEICANTRCRDFFEVERAKQRYCNDVCSRQHRQRQYWESTGKQARRKRMDAQAKQGSGELQRKASSMRAN